MQLLVYGWSSKFGLDRIYSFGDIAIFIFCRCGLKLPIHVYFGVLGAYFPQITSPIVLSPKALSYEETRRLSHKAFSGSTWARSREKRQNRTGQSNKKVTNSGNISHGQKRAIKCSVQNLNNKL